MPKYVDGFVLVVPRKNIKKYQKIAQKAGKVWRDHGALEYFECVGEDLKSGFGVPFPKLAKTKKDEMVVFAWIVYKSRKHRDQVNKKVMADPRLKDMMDPEDMPFNMKRMSYGGFDVIVES